MPPCQCDKNLFNCDKYSQFSPNIYLDSTCCYSGQYLQPFIGYKLIRACPTTQLHWVRVKENIKSEIWKLSFLFWFLNALASLTPEVLSWRQRYWGPSLTDVLWHELSSADVRTAVGFDSVHFRYPLPKWSWSEQTPLPAPPGKLHIGLSPMSESGDCSWMLTLNMATACNVLLNSKICHFRCKSQI